MSLGIRPKVKGPESLKMEKVWSAYMFNMCRDRYEYEYGYRYLRYLPFSLIV